MISHSHKCIFIHIPKTGGTSIEKALGHFDILERDVQDHRFLNQIEPLGRGIEWRYKINRHVLGKEVSYSPDLSRTQFKQYFKFTFVRNPWARVYSWYRNSIEDEVHRKSLQIPKDCDLNYYVKNYLDQWMLQPQLNWITGRNGKIGLNYIGRFEHLSNDFKKVCDHLQLDLDLPKLLYNRYDSHTDAYTENARQLVKRKYHEEIDMFNYKFGG